MDFALVLVSHAFNATADTDRDEHDDHGDASTLDPVHSEADAVNSADFLAVDVHFDLFTDNLSAFGTAHAVVWRDTLSERAVFAPKADWLVALLLALLTLPAFVAVCARAAAVVSLTCCAVLAISTDVVTVFAPVAGSCTLLRKSDAE